jgi:hypothetical protein
MKVEFLYVRDVAISESKGDSHIHVNTHKKPHVNQLLLVQKHDNGYERNKEQVVELQQRTSGGT